MLLVSGVIQRNTTLLEDRLAFIRRRPSYRHTGTHPSLRSVSVCGLVDRSGSLSLTWRPGLFTRWSLTRNTEAPHWVVTRGRNLLAQKPPCSITVTGKVSMLCLVSLLALGQESVWLQTIRMTATPSTPGLDLVQEGDMMIPTRVETRPLVSIQIMEINTLKPWDIF